MRSKLLLGSLALVGAMTFAACDDKDDPVVPATLALQVSSTTVNVMKGSSDNVLATVVRGGSFNNTVTLTAAGAPQGMTITLSDATLASGEVATTMTIAADATTAAGTYPITLTAEGAGVQDQVVTINVTVMTPP